MAPSVLEAAASVWTPARPTVKTVTVRSVVGSVSGTACSALISQGVAQVLVFVSLILRNAKSVTEGQKR